MDLVEVRTEFARSANVERDGARGNPGYVPTSRAREVIRRVTTSLDTPAVGRALSITGTYGSGKSSLAVFASALFGQAGERHDAALAMLNSVDPELADSVTLALSKRRGGSLLIATVTAKREPVTVTIARALSKAVEDAPVATRLLKEVQEIAALSRPTSADIIQALIHITKNHGLLLIIDEFGKNIEEFVKSGDASSDLFVLQEIAEWAAEGDGEPTILLLLQHLAFTDYDKRGTSGREWAKIQGRFSDIPYIESAAESQSLISSVFEMRESTDSWARGQKVGADAAGLADLIHISMSDIFPLHPTSAILLPDLCYRYGQNERTLFAFLAGPDAAAVPELLEVMVIHQKAELPSIRLHHVYDYFLASAPSMVSASPHAARWIEIETRIRDAGSLSVPEIKVLKTVAVLNLVSAGGAARASRAVLHYALADGRDGTKDGLALDLLLETLENRGYLTYREFADEFRIWSGTDYDIQSVVEAARRSLLDESPAQLLNFSRPQIPIVASRHSQTTGVMRVFDRQFIDGTSPLIDVELGQDFDGLVLMCLGHSKTVLTRSDVTEIAKTRPVVLGVARDSEALVEAGLNLAAHQEALRAAESTGADWVAVRELGERIAAATLKLDDLVDNLTSGSAISWRRVVDSAAVKLTSAGSKPLPSVLSTLCDLLYPNTPLIRNEMLSRRVLTAQGAKARRNLLDAMLSSPDVERCGIEGFPPERAMYEAVLGSSQLHRERDGVLDFGSPGESDPLDYGYTWRLLEQCFSEASTKRVGLRDIYLRLMQPPVGLKEGPIPILLTAALIKHAADVAIYEDGTFVPRLAITTVERMLRNPENFSVQSYTLRGPRRNFVEAIAEHLRASTQTPRNTRLPSVVTAVGPLLARLRALPDYTIKTKSLTAKTLALRTAMLSAREPDKLLFQGIPEALGHEAIGARETPLTNIDGIVSELFRTFGELERAHKVLLSRIQSALVEHLAIESNDLRDEVRNRFKSLRESQTDGETRIIVSALVDDHLDDAEWLGYLGMIVAGKPTSAWTDGEAVLTLTKFAADLRRIRNLETLPTERRPGQRAVRLALTEQDGFEDHRVVWIAEAQEKRLHIIVRHALDQARIDIGGNADEALVAQMTIALLRPDKNLAPKTQIKDTQGRKL